MITYWLDTYTTRYICIERQFDSRLSNCFASGFVQKFNYLTSTVWVISLWLCLDVAVSMIHSARLSLLKKPLKMAGGTPNFCLRIMENIFFSAFPFRRVYFIWVFFFQNKNIWTEILLIIFLLNLKYFTIYINVHSH